MKQTILFLSISLLFSCKNETTELNEKEVIPKEIESNKIKVLNFGTFHFGNTSDANKTEFDEENRELQNEVREISKMIAEFQPTIICVEELPQDNEQLNILYQDFLKNSSVLNTKHGETSMIAFDVARLNNVEKIYGIDNKMGYNYGLGDYIENNPDLENSIDSKTYLQLTNYPFKDYPEIVKRKKNYDALSVLEKLKLLNEDVYLDHLMNLNADKLLYVGIEDGFQGADNAAIFYQRNMRIYSNLNRIKMNENDRVFILMGAAHTAFLRNFIKISPKFVMVETLDYLK